MQDRGIVREFALHQPEALEPADQRAELLEYLEQPYEAMARVWKAWQADAGGSE